ncbi:hypothetical protein BGZ70_003987 [Mortierella alpina]|uniref:Uncharacterized protein n=1 Tax=Mortierella alpina TaxID=64518 RepID=A0A9P6JAX3_MORAP|nr:hypothetical protein BGZ70_003987 [Mortierella alpina]
MFARPPDLVGPCASIAYMVDYDLKRLEIDVYVSTMHLEEPKTIQKVKSPEDADKIVADKRRAANHTLVEMRTV